MVLNWNIIYLESTKGNELDEKITEKPTEKPKENIINEKIDKKVLEPLKKEIEEDDFSLFNINNKPPADTPINNNIIEKPKKIIENFENKFHHHLFQ